MVVIAADLRCACGTGRGAQEELGQWQPHDGSNGKAAPGYLVADSSDSSGAASRSVILRRATATDAASLHAFDIGDTPSAWMAEVAEIVSGLIAWQADAAHTELDRQVVVLTDAGDVVAVAAHERQWNETGSVFEHHRYLMVTAVRADRQRHGLARLLVESVLADLQASGTLTVTWLVHPRNHPSIAFSRTCFPSADETSPPEDRPYVAFMLCLS